MQWRSIYPVFGYVKPPPIVIEDLSSYHWAIAGAVIGFIFIYLAKVSQDNFAGYTKAKIEKRELLNPKVTFSDCFEDQLATILQSE